MNNQQAMLDQISSVFGSMGVEGVQIGNQHIPIQRPASLDKLEGFGDTINVGDIFYWTAYDDTIYPDGKWTDGPFRMDSISANPANPWFGATTPSGSRPSANYKGTNWRREFRLADKETTDKMNAALKYEGMYVRLYFTFNELKTPARPVLISAAWIAWVGDLQKAFLTADTPYSKFKKKNIVRWVKTGFFTDFSMKSKIPIPSDFPVTLKGEK